MIVVAAVVVIVGVGGLSSRGHRNSSSGRGRVQSINLYVPMMLIKDLHEVNISEKHSENESLT